MVFLKPPANSRIKRGASCKLLVIQFEPGEIFIASIALGQRKIDSDTNSKQIEKTEVEKVNLFF